ncbi:MAG: hypothetical protein GY811_28555 [Myxococcales bacterium]|nr:hypothetical protein [Myxococcales bacterium]
MGRWQAIGHTRGMLLLAAFTVSCGPTTESHSVEQPTLETVEPEVSGAGWGADVAPGFLRPCVTLSAGNGLVELACDTHQVVEFRKAPEPPEPGAEVPPPKGISDLVELLQARFGPLLEERGEAAIDSQSIETSDFASEQNSESAVSGVAVHIRNTQGQFWGLACYRKGGARANRSFCRDAIATAARAGGLLHVGARPLQSFGDGVLITPKHCQKIPGRKIHCPRGELSWSVGDATSLREQTIKNLQDTAKSEKVQFARSSHACSLFGVAADCELVSIRDSKEGAEMNFLLLTGGEQERLIVCSMPDALASPLPEPCDQAISLAPAK